MKAHRLAIAVAAVSLIAGGRLVLGQHGAHLAVQSAANAPTYSAAGASITMRTVLPTEQTAKMVLNSAPHHPEWVYVPAGSATIRTVVVYPDRIDNAPVVLLTSNNQGLSDWMRAVGYQVASEGFIAVVPDFLSGLGPNGGGTDAFADRQAMARAFSQLGQDGLLHRTKVMRDYAVSLPSGDGKNATLGFNWDANGNARIDVTVDAPKAEKRVASFELTEGAWPNVVAFLTQQTNNRFVPADVDVHAGHTTTEAAAQAPAQAPAKEGPALLPKREDLPAHWRSAKMTMLRTPRRGGWVDIPMGTTKLRTWISYPQGNVKAPVVVVMQPGPGIDDWLRGVGDQLALHGFIGVVPDLLSGLGPYGGNTDSMQFQDEVQAASGKLTPAETMRRYLTARDYALKLPEANGKSASIGFCAGGANSWRFAAEAPGLNAAVVFYGAPPDDATMAKISAPVLALYGEIDLGLAPRIAPATAKMKELGKSFEVHVYPRATHAYLNRQDLAENQKATEDSWPKTVAFLKEHTK